MASAPTGRVHWSFWVIGAIALIWNGLGAINFFVQMNPDMVASYREPERALIADRPAWATVAFGVAVLGGTLGCLLLLLRRAVAFPVLVTSLVGVIVVMIQTLNAGIRFGAGEIAGIIVMPLAVAAFLAWYARYAHQRGWLR